MTEKKSLKLNVWEIGDFATLADANEECAYRVFCYFPPPQTQ